MPYGVDKKLGGDNPSNDAWMEKCVGSISGTNKRTGKPYSKGDKIAICKAQLRKNKSKSSVLPEEVVIDQETIDAYAEVMKECVRKAMQEKKMNQRDAEGHCEAKLSKSGYDIYKIFLLEDI